jgi:protein-tyrosine phosphatase
MIDLHTHLLPGIDDGPKTIEESLDLCRWMVAEGVTVAACTPHVRDDHPTTPEQMESALELLRRHLAAEAVDLDVRSGGEIALDRLPALTQDDLGRFGLGGNPRLLLLEFPMHGWPLALHSTIDQLSAVGTVALIAHPERSLDVQAKPDLLAPLIASGAYVQVTAASLDGNAWPASTRCARTLIDRGLAHVVSSDSHGRAIKRAGLSSVSGLLGDEALAAWLTTRVPAALLAGAPPPPRPPRRQTKRFWRMG